MLTAKIAKRIVDEHTKQWDDVRTEMDKLRLAYEGRFWSSHKHFMSGDNTVRIETSRGYEYVESYVASLFSKNPSVVVKGDLRGKGSARKAQALSNEFIRKVRDEVESSIRMSLIFPMAFIKVFPKQDEDPFHRVGISSVAPWDVILDKESINWESQRFVGHQYWIPLEDAIAKWGKKDQWRAIKKCDFFESRDGYRIKKMKNTSPQDDMEAWVQVVEFYDMTEDKLYIWSEQFDEGRSWCYDGIEIEMGEDEKPAKFSNIPIRTAADEPLIPIVPVYLNRMPYEPLKGYSALGRVYDQIVEINIYRSYQANATRKFARQWLYKKGGLDEEAMSRIAAGDDGEFIGIDVDAGESIADSIAPVPHADTPAELERYIQQVQSDFDRGSVLAPFTRGEATKATASEVTALAAYSASEIGRMARERDAAIEKVARLYISFLRIYMDDEPDILILDGKSEVVSGEDLSGNFSFFAQDSGATPVSEAQKKQELLSSIPLLQQLGVDNVSILKEVVRMLDLPESFLPDEANMEQTSANMPPEQPQEEQMPPDTQLGIAEGSLPSPQQISKVLP